MIWFLPVFLRDIEVEEIKQGFSAKARDEVLGGRNHAFDEVHLRSDELVDPFFNGVAGDELKNLDKALLANPVDTIGGLVLLGRIPPPVIMQNHRGAREVDADTAG